MIAAASCRWGPVALPGTYYYFALAYGSGRVFVNDFNGTVTAFAAATGTEDWSTTTDSFSSEPVAANGTVWVQSGAVLYGLSETTGAVQQQSGYLDGDGNTPAVNSTGVYLSGGCSQFRLSLSATVVGRTTAVARVAVGDRVSCPTAACTAAKEIRSWLSPPERF